MSCSNPQEKNENSFELVKTASISFPIDTATANTGFGLNYYANQDEYLFYLNNQNNDILIFDVKRQTQKEKLHFDREGPASVGILSGFFVHNLDSIFLFSYTKNSIFISDLKGQIKSEIHYEIPDEYSSPNILPVFHSTPFIKEGKIIVKTLPMDNFRELTNDDLKQKHLSYSIDLANGEVQLNPYFYPEDYWSKQIKDFQFSYVGDGEKVVFSFYGDHRLYYSLNLKSPLEAKEAASKFLQGNFGIFKLDGTREERLAYLGSSQHYKSVIYDPYREVFYRLCFPQVAYETEEEVMNYINHPKAFSIMILDKELNIIGESLITESNSNYYPANIFIGKNGLYISNSHPENEEIIEDELSFSLFELKKVI